MSKGFAMDTLDPQTMARAMRRASFAANIFPSHLAVSKKALREYTSRLPISPCVYA